MSCLIRFCLAFLFLISVASEVTARERALRVALLADAGVGKAGITNVTGQLVREGMEVVHVTGEQIASGVLADFDAVVFTGGSGSKQGNALGEQGRENVRNFVRNGGGYVGICAGAYLACSGFSWGVGVLDAKTVDSRWRRGKGTVRVEVTSEGNHVTGLSAGVHDVRYANGPILTPHGRDNIPPYETIAYFRTELSGNGTPKGIMVNSPAIARGYYGQGRVVVSSPHPESTDGLKDTFAPSAVRWAAAGKASFRSVRSASDRVAELGAKIQEVQQKYFIVGLSAVAVKNGAVVWNTNFGLADIKREVPVTDRTKFRIASISKTVATTALMQLREQGRFDLDEDISRYLGWKIVNPHHPDKPITIRQLLTHTSSLTDNSNYNAFLRLTYKAAGRAPDLRELLHVNGKYFNNGASFSTNAPGANYSYCNLAFGMVGTLVEKISGENFQSYCQKNILGPLRMTASFNVALLPDINDLSALYTPSEDGFEAQFDEFGGEPPTDRIGRIYRPGQNALVFGPQGGLRVSALDLSKFMVQFMDRRPFGTERILRKSTIRMMLGEQWTKGGQGTDYLGRGLGFQRTQSLRPGELWIGHTGSAYGLRSSMFFLPDKSMGVILITNGSRPGEPVNGYYAMQREVTELLIDFMKQPSARKAVVTRR